MFGLFSKRSKKAAPALSDADQKICREQEEAYAEWSRAFYGRDRARNKGAAEAARAEAEFELADERWSAARRAHKDMMERLTAEARAAIVAKGGV